MEQQMFEQECSALNEFRSIAQKSGAQCVRLMITAGASPKATVQALAMTPGPPGRGAHAGGTSLEDVDSMVPARRRRGPWRARLPRVRALIEGGGT